MAADLISEFLIGPFAHAFDVICPFPATARSTVHGIRTLRTLYVHELVHLLRDRHTLIYSVVIPIFLYPTILFLVFQSMAVVEGWKERQVSRIEIRSGERHPLLVRLFEEEEGLDFLVSAADSAVDESSRRRLRERELDAIVSIDGALDGDGGPLMVSVHHCSVHDASRTAVQRVEKVLEGYRQQVLEVMAHEVGRGEDFLDVMEVEDVDIASGEKKANYVLSLTMPLLMVVIILMGAFYPALDATAGERERGTFETTLVAPVSRMSLVLGKYLAVVTLALAAFALNFLSMTFSFKHLISQIRISAFTVSFSSIVVILLGAVLLVALIAALMMAIAFLARSFKEGQSYMAPTYLLGLAPIVATLSPEVRLTPLLAATPVVNITIVFREVLQSRFDWPMIMLTLGFSVFWTTTAITVAAWLVSREEFLLGDNRSFLDRLVGLFARRSR